MQRGCAHLPCRRKHEALAAAPQLHLAGAPPVLQLRLRELQQLLAHRRQAVRHEQLPQRRQQRLVLVKKLAAAGRCPAHSIGCVRMR